ncbi:MAG: TIGR02206 family membrane protein [Planctomycetes bacterium]|nr:TIGR02206 family membrane protein [Planctomycetota bacterium]
MPATDVKTFQFMGLPHVAVLIGTAVTAAALVWAGRREGAARLRWAACVAMAAALLATEAVSYALSAVQHGWVTLLREGLPLHLCGVAVYLTAIVLLTRRQWVFEVALYWGVIGTVQALLTPSVTESWHSIWFWLYFIRHAFIVIGALFAWLALGMHPRRRSAWRVWLGTNGWLLVVAGFNAVARSNYMFLCKAPEVASPLAAVPWPWYVVIADVLMLVGFLWLERLSRKYGPSHPPR